MRSLLASLAVTGLATSVLTLAAPAEALSCVGPATVVRGADRVFTGRIVDSEDGRLEVRVIEVWKGAPVDRRQRLGVDLVGWSGWAGRDGTIPDGFSSPRTWVFAPHGDAVNPCTAWRSDWQGLRRLRPDRPAAPVSAGPIADVAPGDPAPGSPVRDTEPGRTAYVVGGGLTGAVTVGLAGVWWWRRR